LSASLGQWLTHHDLFSNFNRSRKRRPGHGGQDFGGKLDGGADQAANCGSNTCPSTSGVLRRRLSKNETRQKRSDCDRRCNSDSHVTPPVGLQFDVPSLRPADQCGNSRHYQDRPTGLLALACRYFTAIVRDPV
jgi:hypothetical protein